MPRKSPPAPTTGVGELRYPGFTGQVDYSVAGDPAALTARSSALRGQFTADAEVAQAAFRAGGGYLTLEGGKACRLTLLGYTAGSDTAYFEISL